MQEIHDPTDDPRGNALFKDFREAWAEGHDLPALFGSKGMLEIKEPVGPAARNRRPDVAKLETFLDALGEHDAARTDGPTGFYGIGFEDNLKAYQARNGLTPDGLVNPDGETLGRIKQDLAETLGPGALTGGDDGVDGSRPGGRLIPAQSSGGSPIGRRSEPSDRERRARQEFLEASRQSERRLRQQRQSEEARRQRQEFLRASRDSERSLKQQEKEAFLEASRASERRLPDQVRELERKHQLLLRIAMTVRDRSGFLTPNESILAFERYLDGTGGMVEYNADWIRSQKIIKRAENRVLDHFADWMCGKPLRTGGPPPAVANKILKLKPGASLSDAIDRSAVASFTNPTNYDKITDFYNLSKDSNIKGFENFSFTRKGNIIHVSGTIDQNWRDTYDFAPGKTFRFPPRGPVLARVKTDDLIFLHRMGKARPFQLRSSWRRRVVGQIQITKDPNTGKEEIGSVTLKWTD